MGDGEEMEGEEEEEESEWETDTSDSEAEGRALVKPVFVRASQRATIEEREQMEKEAAEAGAKEESRKTQVNPNTLTTLKT